ncbi:acylneuraminate cytidylyltransferase family protein [Sulfuricurvum sp. IAE1]|nr:acylneuraminate cytidylyltransferase family protein [Sulfuricurvum sp. IAE1]TDA65746.1 acylneuraminate cytidylyltransferase family protein [Sulfuricurvum sp. IAE1]
MISDKKVLAVVPARSGSKGLPGKNIRPFCGKPLLQWSVEHGLKAACVDRVVVSTDSEIIADIAMSSGADVPFLRPPELASDTATSVDVVLHAAGYLAEHGDPFDLVVLLEPTSPLREAKDIDSAMNMLFADPQAESIVSVAPVGSQHPSFLMKLDTVGNLTPFAGSFRVLRRQETEPLFFLDGTLYISKLPYLGDKKTFYHDRTMGYVVPKFKSFEIDDIDDFIVCEAVFRERFSGLSS